MSVYEFCFLYIEGTEDVKLWSIEDEYFVFEGTYDGAKSSKYANEDVQSFGVEDGIIVINI